MSTSAVASSAPRSTTSRADQVATFDDVRRVAMTLPETEEILTWETDVTFRVRKKIFAIGGDGAPHVSIKATPDAQADLLDRDPETFASAPYVGRYGWVNVRLTGVDQEETILLLYPDADEKLRWQYRYSATRSMRPEIPERSPFFNFTFAIAEPRWAHVADGVDTLQRWPLECAILQRAIAVAPM